MSRVLVGTASCFLSALVACAPPEPPDRLEAQATVQEVQQALTHERPAALLPGLKDMQRVARLDPPPAGALALLGEVYERLELQPEALSEFDALLEQRPHDPELMLWAAHFRHPFPAHHQEATEIYQRLLQEFPERLDVYERYAGFLHGLGDYQGESLLLERALTRWPEHRDLANLLGLAYNRTGRMEQARIIFRQLLDEDPSYTYAALNLGYLHLSDNKLGVAAQLFRQVLEHDPLNSEALYNLARIAVRRGDIRRAQVILRSLESATRAP